MKRRKGSSWTERAVLREVTRQGPQFDESHPALEPQLQGST